MHVPAHFREYKNVLSATHIWSKYVLCFLVMTYDLFAICEWPVQGRPRRLNEDIFVANYATLGEAQWWALNLKRVYRDVAKTEVVPERGIVGFRIVEIS